MYHNIPMELRAYKQWVCWRYEMRNGKRTKVPYSANGQYNANINNPASWGSFDEAIQTSRSATMDGIGFVLTENDPYVGIDIDDKEENPASEQERETHRRILDAFQSYTERSVGGRGYHIIIRGQLQGGRDRGHVGVYSTQRYLTFSGQVVRNAPIVDYQALLEQLVEQMPDNGHLFDLEEVDGVLSDKELNDMAEGASNGAKYLELCQGDWQAMGYPSQSEADLALLSILCFYSRDNEQVRRVFRYSALGKRDKSTQNNVYLNRTLALIRSKQPTSADYEGAAQAAASIVAAAQPAPALPALPAPLPATPVQLIAPASAPAPVPAPSAAVADATGYSLPPGLVGELAQYFYSTAVRPVQEVALLAAIGMLAGIAGRSYNISGTGLNQYLVLIAKTGTGKEAAANGIEHLLAAVRPEVPMIDDFIGPGAFASGQALIRVLDARPCFLSVLGEIGLTLQQLNDPRAPSAVVMLKRVLLDLYAKSGWNKVLRSTAYSDSEKNTKTIRAPNMSFLGDATPETFFDQLSNADIADGLIPRLQVLEYKGKRPRRNRSAGHPPSAELVKRFGEMAAIAISTGNNNTCASIQTTPEALALMDSFDEECDDAMGGSATSGETQLWNRAHLKALKLAGIIAVGVAPHAPVVTADVARWAIDFTKSGTQCILERFQQGDVGHGDDKQRSDMRRAVSDYFKMDAHTLHSYKTDLVLQKAGMIPYAYLVVRASKFASFYKDKQGSAKAIKAALNELVQMEVLNMLTPLESMGKFGKRQALYFLGKGW